MGRPLSCPSTLPDVRQATRSTHTGSQSTGAWYNTKCQPSRRYRSRERYLSASILIGIDVPEERQKQVLTNQDPEDGREDTCPSAQRHVPIIQKIAETPQVVQRECRSSGRSRRLLRHHRNSCGRCRGSSSSRRRLCTRQVLVIQSPEDRVCPTGTGHGHDRRSWSWSSISHLCCNTKYRQS